MRYIFIFLLCFSTCFAQQVKVKVPPNKDTVVVTFNVSTNTTYSTSTIPTQGNKPPIANAGIDQTITLPTNTVTLFSTGSSDPEGGVIKTAWAKVSGPNNPVLFVSGSACNVSGLIQGVYVFRLSVIDDIGLTKTDDVNVIVNPDNTTPPPSEEYTLTFSTGYDALSDMLYKGNGQYGNGTISTTTYLTGPGSFYSRPANVSSGIRSEVQYGEDIQNWEEGAVEFDVMFEVIIPNNGHFLQQHPQTGGGSASYGFMIEGGKFAMENWKNGVITWYRSGIVIKTQQWYHVRVEHKFGSSGYVNTYLDNVKIDKMCWIGQVGDNSGHYLKVGYNGWDASSSNSRIYYDNLKVYKKN